MKKQVDASSYTSSRDTTAAPAQLTVDASPLYLMTPEAPRSLLELNPEARAIFILRNPADVAFANFVNHVRDGLEDAGIDAAPRVLSPAAPPRESAGLHPFCDHLAVPRYALHLPAWLEVMPAHRRKILIYEEVIADQAAALDEICAFLGIETGRLSALPRDVNVSALPRSRRLQRLTAPPAPVRNLLRRLSSKAARKALRHAAQRLNRGDKPTLAPELRAELDAFYEADRAFVRDLLGRRIPGWPE